jgi:hypothetical protein
VSYDTLGRATQVSTTIVGATCAEAASVSSSLRSAPQRLRRSLHFRLLGVPFTGSMRLQLAEVDRRPREPRQLAGEYGSSKHGESALTLENCPENGSSMQTPTQSGPAKRWTTP